MNARQIIRETIADLVEISRSDIEAAISELDILDMITDALTTQLPEAIKDLVEEEIEEAVSDAIDDALN